MSDQQFIQNTREWIERVVIGLNLCPFARRELERDSIRFVVLNEPTEQALLQLLESELGLLVIDSDVETTFLIHPFVLDDFLEFNQFLDVCDRLLRANAWEGVFQIASFHPRYEFAESPGDAAENFSNRSPYPMLHLLREDSVTRAVGSHPDAAAIPTRNVQTLQKLGAETMAEILTRCGGE